MNSSFNSLSARDLRRAAEIKEKIDSLQNELVEILASDSVTSNRRTGRRRKMTAAARARIAAGARARWAKVREGRSLAVKKPKMKRSVTVRARLAAIARERWRKAKAAGKTTL